jgi:transcriptional regulator with PAS, ATPase and Fis domain
MSLNTENERRNHRRENLHLPLQISCDATQRDWVSAEMVDACPTGLQLSLPDQLNVHPSRSLNLRLPFSEIGNYELGVAVIRHMDQQPGHRLLGVVLQREAPFFAGVEMLGMSPRILEIKSLLPKIAASGLNVLIRGETGTGKNILARLIHNLSRGEQLPFIRVNCPSIPESLFESELFGHEKGAFTDAKSAEPGYFRLAAGGTILLDEISEIQPHLQAKLLSVIEEKQFIPVGGHKQAPVHAGIIATTNQDLEKAVEEGRFRQDLFYRLCEMPIQLPPLRERKEDVPLLVQYFLQRYSEKFQRPFRMLSSVEMASLTNYSWPGNIRELENYLKQTALLEKFVGPEKIDPHPTAPLAAGGGPLDLLEQLLKEHLPLPELLKKVTGQVERVMIQNELDICDQNRSCAAGRLGISYRTLLRKLEQY